LEDALSALTGIGGMSEWTIMTGPDRWKISYPLFIIGMVAIGANRKVRREGAKGAKLKHNK